MSGSDSEQHLQIVTALDNDVVWKLLLKSKEHIVSRKGLF